jgi:hypothetical protein
METLHPPYGPGSIQPRRLNRWLDVNSQNGPLTRTAKYLVIPQIPAIDHVWNGFSDIVGVIYYDSPKNFSIKAIPYAYTSKFNFLMCIAWLESDGVVYRYVINDVERPLFYLNAPVYNGQMIGRNMRFEIWSLSAALPYTDSNSPVLYTSVSGEYDYRFGDDDALTDYSGALMSGFSVDLDVNFPIFWPAFSTFGSNGSAGVIPGTVVPPTTTTVTGAIQVYSYTGTIPTFNPASVNVPAIAYKLGGGPMFTWNTTTHVWE